MINGDALGRSAPDTDDQLYRARRIAVSHAAGGRVWQHRCGQKAVTSTYADEMGRVVVTREAASAAIPLPDDRQTAEGKLCTKVYNKVNRDRESHSGSKAGRKGPG